MSPSGGVGASTEDEEDRRVRTGSLGRGSVGSSNKTVAAAAAAASGAAGSAEAPAVMPSQDKTAAAAAGAGAGAGAAQVATDMHESMYSTAVETYEPKSSSTQSKSLLDQLDDEQPFS